MSVAKQAERAASGKRGMEDMEGSLAKGLRRAVRGECWRGIVVMDMARNGLLGERRSFE